MEHLVYLAHFGLLIYCTRYFIAEVIFCSFCPAVFVGLVIKVGYHIFSGGAVVYWLVCWTSDLKVGGSTPSLCNRVVSLDKKLCPTLSLSTQVYKIGTGDMLLGVSLRWTSIPSSGE